MNTIIALLTLALSLLQAVQANPNLPQPIRDEAVTFAQEVILQADTLVATSTPADLEATTTPVVAAPTDSGAAAPAPAADMSAPATTTQAAAAAPTLYPNNCPFPDLSQRQIIQDGNRTYDANTGLQVDVQTGTCL